MKHFTQARGLMESYDNHEIKIIGDLAAPLSEDEISEFYDGPLFPK